MKAGLPVFPLGVEVHNLKADRRCRKNAVMYVCCFPYCAPSIANSRALAIDQESESVITLHASVRQTGSDALAFVLCIHSSH